MLLSPSGGPSSGSGNTFTNGGALNKVLAAGAPNDIYLINLSMDGLIIYPHATNPTSSLSVSNDTAITGFSAPLMANSSSAWRFDSSPTLSLVSFPSLTQISGGFIGINNNTALTSFVHALATIAGDLNIYGCTALPALSFPLLTSLTGGLHAYGCTAATSATFTLLSSIGAAGELDLYNGTALTALSFPALTSCAGILDVHGCTAATSLSLPTLASIAGQVIANGLTSCTTTDFAALASLDGSLNLSGVVDLSLAFPVLATLEGTLNISNSTATSLDIGSLSSIGAAGVLNGNNSSIVSVSVAATLNLTDGFTISLSGCALDVTSVDAILAACVAGLGTVTTGTIDLSAGSSAAPSNPAGDKQTLINAGITVTTN